MEKKKHLKSRDINVGYRNGLLTVTELITVNGLLKAICKCDCGKDSIKLRWELAIKFADNCGCLRTQKISNRLREHYGNNTGKKRAKPPLYGVYNGIVQRTTNTKNKQYHRYGGRGIKCEWNSYEEFYKDMGDSYKEGLTIDRINNDGNYSKKNCRWATASEQSRNRSSNILVGNQCLMDYCKEHNLKFSTMQGRITTLGWDIEDAIFTPIKKRTPNKNLIQ